MENSFFEQFKLQFFLPSEYLPIALKSIYLKRIWNINK